MRPEFNDDENELNKLENGWARAALALRTSMRFGHHGNIRGLSLDAVHGQLEARRERYYKGSTMELLHAVQTCAEENVPLPHWLAIAFNDAFAKFLADGTSLDKVFSAPNLPTTKKRARTVRRDWKKGVSLWIAVREIASQHTGLDGALKKVLGEPGFNWIELTAARKLVAQIDKTQTDLMNGRHEPLSRIFKKTRNRPISA